MKNFKVGKYNISAIRMGNTGRKVPVHIDRFEYHFSVKDKKREILHLDVPANSYESAKRGLKGAMRVRKIIDNKNKKQIKKK
ncbi:hypothetical protein LCGC14_1336250 [marine sediment metagenome]|uniref:Uncharacterized protein n=1 Tax=marine sediment metagenome TaxID=412755 RepID=A0A0F9L185_9ZZZZ